jgi:alkylhydroperoxidase/carboxymuconolactone decarboxylase family protein YurZ
MRPVNNINLKELHDLAEAMLHDSPEGEPLDALAKSLIALGLATSVTSLDQRAIDGAIESAQAAGATPAQLQETLSLVSGLGVHSLMASAARIAKACGLESAPLLPHQQALWARHVGDDPYWAAFEGECPGFLGAMLRLSADQFSAFFDYCAVPWQSRQVPAKIKELIALACDATPAHRFGPGFRLHLANAIKLGTGRRAVAETLALAAEAPEHKGWR